MTLADIITNHLCTGCGTCAGVCPSSAISMVPTPDGFIRADIDPSLCKTCDLCAEICPQIHPPKTLMDGTKSPLTGTFQSTWLASAKDSKDREEGQTGGFVRTVVRYLLESQRVDAVLTVIDNPADPLRPQALWLKSMNDLPRLAKSKYCPVSLNSLLKNIKTINGDVAVTGLGCHLHGLINAADRFPDIKRKIAFKIGLFCDRILSFYAAEFLVRSAGVSVSNVSGFEYRHKGRHGGYGDPKIQTRDGNDFWVPNSRRIAIRELFTPLACRLCVDKLNILADISCGDPHGMDTGNRTPTFVLARTAAGEDLINEMITLDLISCKKTPNITPDNLTKWHKLDQRLNRCLTYGAALKEKGYLLPYHLQHLSPDTILPRHVKRRTRMALWCAEGKINLKNIPVWIPLLPGKISHAVGVLKRAIRKCFRI
ncbi:Coenzyme F420 hydrogenase/dehydrogenase, beta subunit C-terminal domain [bacterium]|nr:Coenzyme F420 hydrogenase/dehydrogenase, beta subunit C-terminal domain [candidate division CSSED10-310 bacterium]